MKSAIAAILLPLALAANINSRQSTDIEFEISGFTASCMKEQDYCDYGLGKIVSSNNPEFGVGCDVPGTSANGTLPAVPETQCGTYKVTVDRADDGGLLLTVYSDKDRVSGTHHIVASDLTIDVYQSYTGATSFTIDASSSGSSSTPSTTITVATTTSSTTAVESTTTSATTTESSGSATGTTTSSSPSSSSSTDTSGAIRKRIPAGVVGVLGLVALMF
ncbi:hypothetical protein PFICI_11152 [Pestalotiopsis fici W106-1]|uniref:Uncharacterized protein n=1 Tax=Pestalotiopsis fici (strain W106-1 / CGMCC3.15140) TaxID=1229662 RepID=W3WTT7_PESFW|nr:uncharacterized protein PFICI_11152 [Pestalotiopsis fici W106-1]ETS77278.1 hypothetical protein PFICI_11152 [Pestalotiopsis fici W106-1]